jgi:hypothetical protein
MRRTRNLTLFAAAAVAAAVMLGFVPSTWWPKRSTGG